MHSFILWRVTLAFLVVVGTVVSTSIAGDPNNTLHLLAGRAGKLKPATTCEYYKVTTRFDGSIPRQRTRVTLRLDFDKDGWRNPGICNLPFMKELRQFATASGYDATIHRFGVKGAACLIKIETSNQKWILPALGCLAASRRPPAQAPGYCVSGRLYLFLVYPLYCTDSCKVHTRQGEIVRPWEDQKQWDTI